MADTWGGYRSWSEHAVLRDCCLMTPVRLLWNDYLQHCSEWGFAPADATSFVQWLRGEEGVRLAQGGRGRLHRVALGVAPLRVLGAGHRRHGGAESGKA